MLRSVSANFAEVSNKVKEFYFSIRLSHDGTEPAIRVQFNKLLLAISGFSNKLNDVSTRSASRLVGRVDVIYLFLTGIITNVRDTALAPSLSNSEKIDIFEKALNKTVFEIAKIIAE